MEDLGSMCRWNKVPVPSCRGGFEIPGTMWGGGGVVEREVGDSWTNV